MILFYKPAGRSRETTCSEMLRLKARVANKRVLVVKRSSCMTDVLRPEPLPIYVGFQFVLDQRIGREIRSILIPNMCERKLKLRIIKIFYVFTKISDQLLLSVPSQKDSALSVVLYRPTGRAREGISFNTLNAWAQVASIIVIDFTKSNDLRPESQTTQHKLLFYIDLRVGREKRDILILYMYVTPSSKRDNDLIKKIYITFT